MSEHSMPTDRAKEAEMANVMNTTSPHPGRLLRKGNVVTLVLDDPAKRVNTLSSRFMAWFGEVLAELERLPPAALVLVSGKKDSFVAGADIEELQAATSAAEIETVLRQGHALMQRLTRAPFVTVAAIHGACLGGGLELALACDLRVATDHEKTRLGLPEVQLGLIPGLGGTQRLPRLIGVPAALDMILTGKPVRAAKARRLGLVNEICHPADLAAAVRRLLARPMGVAGGTAASGARKKGLLARATDLAARTPGTRELIFRQAKKSVLEKTGGHYPAPLVALEVVKEGLALPLPEALAFESGAFSTLVVSEEAKSLMGIFFMKNDVEARAAAIARQGRPVERAGVLGAGFMGAGITQGLAHKGMQVVLKDRDLPSLGRGLKQIGGLFQGLVKRRRYRPVESEVAMSRIVGTVSYEAFRGVDFVVEAVFEDLAVKHAVLRDLEAVAPDFFIFASNTSTLPIAEIAAGAKRPENVVGMHFFSPVHKMPLLEVIRHPGTSEEALATTVAVGQRMGKTTIVVEDGPGFFTSRVLGPFVNEAAWCLTEGASIDQIDRAMTRWGWPVGPLALLDEVGLDIASHAGGVMRQHLGPRFDPPPALALMIADGRKGRKGGRGFYTYGDGEKAVDPEVYDLLGWQPGEIADREIVERCWLQMLNETARCMEDGVIENPADVDIGVIFGFGFPPFRGGLLKVADRHGLDWVVRRLDHYADLRGERLRPAELLREMAREGRRFHPPAPARAPSTPS